MAASGTPTMTVQWYLELAAAPAESRNLPRASLMGGEGKTAAVAAALGYRASRCNSAPGCSYLRIYGSAPRRLRGNALRSGPDRWRRIGGPAGSPPQAEGLLRCPPPRRYQAAAARAPADWEGAPP